MKQTLLRWRANFLTGLAVVLPAVISIAIFRWLFGTVSNVTDTLLFFLPHAWTHGPDGLVFWYWSLTALIVGILIVIVLGRAARNYLGRKMIKFMDQVMFQVPLLNKIYGTVKQVNEAFSTGKKSSFKQVVLFEYPRAGLYSVGFVTSDEHPEAAARLNRKLLGVFVPTTPNPTSGFLIVVPEEEVIKLDMSVADGIKYIISLGAITPAYKPLLPASPVPANPVD